MHLKEICVIVRSLIDLAKRLCKYSIESPGSISHRVKWINYYIAGCDCIMGLCFLIYVNYRYLLIKIRIEYEDISGRKAHTNTRRLNRNISTITDAFHDQKIVNACEHTVKTAPRASALSFPCAL